MDQRLDPAPFVHLATTQCGRHRLMAMPWHMMMEYEPPLDDRIVNGRHLSFETQRRTRDCILAISDGHLGRQAAGIGNCSGAPQTSSPRSA